MPKLIINDYVSTTNELWTVEQFCNNVNQGLVSFDNIIQRNLVWTPKQKSLLIHSLIVNFMPPEFLANKSNGKYDMIDGKQRHNAIASYINNEYTLSDVPIIESADREIYNFNGNFFSDLPKEVQDKITNRELKFSIIDNAPQEVIQEYFYRRNNGTTLSNIRKTLVTAKSFDAINDLSKHPLFKMILSTAAIENDEARNIVMKTYGILYFDGKSLENKKVFASMKKMSFLPEHIDTIKSCYDILMKSYKHISDKSNKENRQNRQKILTRIKTKTHVITLMPIIADIVISKKISTKTFAEWLCIFFNGTEGATPYIEYNNNSIRGSSQVTAVTTRVRIAKESLSEFLNRK